MRPATEHRTSSSSFFFFIADLLDGVTDLTVSSGWVIFSIFSLLESPNPNHWLLFFWRLSYYFDGLTILKLAAKKNWGSKYRSKNSEEDGRGGREEEEEEEVRSDRQGLAGKWDQFHSKPIIRRKRWCQERKEQKPRRDTGGKESCPNNKNV